MNARADDAKTAGCAGAAVANIRCARNIVEVDPAAVLCRNNALGTENHTVGVCIRESFQRCGDLLHSIGLCGFHAPAGEHIVRMVVVMLVVVIVAAAGAVLTVVMVVVMMMVLVLLMVMVVIVVMTAAGAVLAVFMVMIVMMMLVLLVIVLMLVVVVVMLLLFCQKLLQLIIRTLCLCYSILQRFCTVIINILCQFPGKNRTVIIVLCLLVIQHLVCLCRLQFFLFFLNLRLIVYNRILISLLLRKELIPCFPGLFVSIQVTDIGCGIMNICIFIFIFC